MGKFFTFLVLYIETFWDSLQYLRYILCNMSYIKAFQGYSSFYVKNNIYSPQNDYQLLQQKTIRTQLRLIFFYRNRRSIDFSSN